MFTLLLMVCRNYLLWHRHCVRAETQAVIFEVQDVFKPIQDFAPDF